MMSASAVLCTACESTNLKTVMSFGEQPPSNRFVSPRASGGDVPRFPLSLGYCADCGTIQLIDRMPLDEVRPRYDWLTYNEPEGHLDKVSETLTALNNMNKTSRILGLTYKDQSTLERLSRKGFDNSKCIEVGELAPSDMPFGLETIQAKLTDVATITFIKEKYGVADLVLVRHITEHAVSAKKMLCSIASFVVPGGYIMLELPDSAGIFAANRHPFIWEEHLSYFTEGSARRLAAEVGMQLVSFDRYRYPFEDSLIVVMQVGATDTHAPPKISTSEGKKIDALLHVFARSLVEGSDQWRKYIVALRRAGKKVAMFGAGHLSVRFINFYGLADLIECVIDDHPSKVGMLMPGSHLPIVASSELLVYGITHCLSTLSPESEARVRNHLTGYFSSGGSFVSAFEMPGTVEA